MACKSGPNITTEGLVFNLDPSNSKGYPAINDPYRNDVSLLLDFDEGFIDKSRNNTSFTTTGSPSITTNSKYGSGAGSFNGSNSYIEPSLNTTTSFGTGDFTIEFWFYTNSTTNQQNILDKIGSANRAIYMAAGGQLRYYNGSADGITGATLSANTWYHIALVKISSVTKLYLNGSQTGSNYNDSLTYSTSNVRIGAAFNNTCYVDGRIDDLRITVGIGRYSATFTPPDRLTALPARAYDLRNDATATLTSGPIFSNVQNGVISFDASNDWISLPASSLLTFGTGNFTIDIWYRPNAKTNLYPQLIGNNITWQANCWALIDRHASTNPTQFSFHFYNYSTSAPILKSTTTPSNNNWYNLTVTRVGSTFSMYVNGILETTATSAASLDGGVSYTVVVGGDSINGGTTIIDGNIGNLRIHKGKGLSATEVSQNYVANRQKYVEIPRTFSGLAVWFDGADLSTLRQNSNATTAATLNSDPVGYWADKSGNGRNATQATAGNRVALSNGARSLDPAIRFAANNWLDLASYTASFGTGSFTIEGWIKPAGYSGTSILLTTGMSGMFVAFTPAGLLNFGKYGVGTTIASTSAISTTSWTKFAITRSGTSLKLFLNDVLNASATDSLSYTGGSAMRIGFDAYSPTGNTKYNGLLQNLLIYEGFSKYN